MSGQPQVPPALRYGEIAPVTCCVRDWMGSTAGPDALVKTKIALPVLGIESRFPGYPSRSLVTMQCPRFNVL
jgi:hypothetical protein